MWVDKYRPRKTSEMVGNEEARIAVSLWLKKWKVGSKSLLIVGPPGTGKTTLVSLLAEENGLNLVALNASDVRTKEKLGRKIGEATRAVSLYGGTTLIFLDEVDGLLGRSDYGGVEFIKDAVKDTLNPIIMAANDPEADEVKRLAAACVTVVFKPPPPREVELYLVRIAARESLEMSSDEIRRCVIASGGDLRHAINALQSRGGDGPAARKDIDLTTQEGLNAFFDAEDPGTALEALRRVSLQPVEKLREIQRSVIKAGLSRETLASALRVLSNADMVMGRIMNTQEWRQLRYLDGMLAHELQPIVRGRGVRYIASGDLPFSTLLRIWNDSKKVTEISRRYASASHTGAGSARTQDLPFIFSLSSDRRFREQLERALDLDETYDKFLQKEAKGESR